MAAHHRRVLGAARVVVGIERTSPRQSSHATGIE